MDPEVWLEELAAALPGADVVIGEAERDVLLDLARIAAHTSERWTAPISTFVAGLALARAAPQQRLEHLRRVVDVLDDPDESTA